MNKEIKMSVEIKEYVGEGNIVKKCGNKKNNTTTKKKDNKTSKGWKKGGKA